VRYSRTGKPAALMIAYTNYESDARVIREAEAAVRSGFEVDFLALRRGNEAARESIRGVQVIRLRQARYRGAGKFRYFLAYLEFFVRCAFKCTGLFFKRKYRIIHVNNLPDPLVFCTLIPKLLGARVLLDIHDPMPDTFTTKFKVGNRGWVYRCLVRVERLSAWYCDAVLTVSDPVKTEILARHGIPLDRIHVIANFADDELFALRPYSPVDGKTRMVFHGTILERYGLEDLALALSVMKHRDRVSVKIIGEGDFSPRLAELIHSLGLSETVDFDNQFYPLHRIPDIVTGFNLGLAPLRCSTTITNYGLPVKMLEYLSLGLPVLTIRNAVIRHYFGEDDCLFYEAGNVASLAATLDRIVDEPELLAHYHNRAVQLRGTFGWSGQRQKYVDVLWGLIREDCARSRRDGPTLAS
jgi:glycosyltransferase involved in cell wall biosynthesis